MASLLSGQGSLFNELGLHFVFMACFVFVAVLPQLWIPCATLCGICFKTWKKALLWHRNSTQMMGTRNLSSLATRISKWSGAEPPNPLLAYLLPNRCIYQCGFVDRAAPRVVAFPCHCRKKAEAKKKNHFTSAATMTFLALWFERLPFPSYVVG